VTVGSVTGARVTDTALLYEHLFHTQFQPMVRLAALLGSDDPENVAQEAFVRVHAALPRLAGQDAVLAYLRRTVVNATHSRHRHLRVAARRQWELLPTAVESAEELTVREENRRRVVAALGQLRREQREVLILRYWSRLSVDETAAALEIAPGTVKSMTSRAMRKLAEMLGEDR
jgi:RNA polymerase sigma factor (sigma-70 family)